MKIFKKYWPVLLLSIVTVFTFKDLPSAYFEQDEWHTFGHYLYLSSLSPIEFIKNAFPSGQLGHFTPLSLLTKFGIYKLFGLDARIYFYISIFLHLLVSLALYVLIYLKLRKKYLALIAALFFLVNSSHHQAITWLGNFEGTEGATLFSLIALIFFTVYEQNQKTKFFIASLCSIFIALLFKEIAFGFVLVSLALILISKVKHQKRLILSLIGCVGLYIFLRLFVASISPQEHSTVSVYNSIPETLIYNQLLIPSKFLLQTIIPLVNFDGGVINQSVLSGSLNKLGNYGISISNNQLVTIVSLFASIFLILLIFIRTKRDINLNKLSILGVLIIIASSTPLLLIKKFTLFLDSRYLYPATVGTAIILVSLIASFKDFGLPKKVILGLIVVLISAHLLNLRDTIKQLKIIGQERKDILTQIKTITPSLGSNTIIYAESNKSFYGLSDRMLPFQSGLGETLLVYYGQYQKIPPQFFTQEFLWNIKDEGYKKYDNLGFGFFWNIEKIAEAISQNNISVESVYGISYNFQDRKITDITSRVRGEIRGKFAKKTQVDLPNISSTASLNPNDTKLAFDGKRETFWDSHTPYYIPQYFQIDLGKPVNVVQISIDAFNNKDQNEVGYRLKSSLDGEHYQEIFRANRFTPLQNGVVDIYLAKVLARYIKIEQIGYHLFAPWVIHELRIYEAAE